MKFLSFLLTFLLLSSLAVALDIYPRPTMLVNDHAGVLSASETAALEQQLQTIKASGRAEIAVLLIPTLDTDSIEDYSLRTAEAWQLGNKDKDNGLLITIAVSDHQYRFEVGYGLEGSLNDARVGKMGRDILVPAFQANDYAGGISQTITTIDGILQNDPDVVAAVDAPDQLPLGFLFLITFFAGTIVSKIGWQLPTKTGKITAFTIGHLLIVALIWAFAAYFLLFAIPVLLFTIIFSRSSGMPFIMGGFGRRPGGGLGGGGFRIGGGGGFGGGGASGRW